MASEAVVIISKSRWDPPIRREHQLARLAAADGRDVTFIESPSDIRTLLQGRGAGVWLSRHGGSQRRRRPGGVETVARSVLVPAHVHRFLEPLETRSLAAVIPPASGPSTIVATLPWHWQALRRASGYRRVLDVADDWSEILPRCRRRIRDLYKCAAAEADAITVVSDALHELFPGRDVQTVRNGLDSALLRRPFTDPPHRQRLVYVGTLSERFDSFLVGALLEALPGWHLDLYGACSYARRGGRPGDELAALLQRVDGRVAWHGPVSRSDVAAVLDAADVLLLPNRAQSKGQDSMKVYDYSARGRPVVATEASVDGISERPPHLFTGSTAASLAEHVRDALDEPKGWSVDRVVWARRQAWEERWTGWSDVLFGRESEQPVGDVRRSKRWRDPADQAVTTPRTGPKDGGSSS